MGGADGAGVWVVIGCPPPKTEGFDATLTLRMRPKHTTFQLLKNIPKLN